MKIQLLAGLIAFFSLTLTHADWIEYADNGKAVFYYDPATVQINKDKVIVWEMLNYSFPLNRVLSSKTRKEYDCGKQLFRNLSGEFFAGPYSVVNASAPVKRLTMTGGWRSREPAI